MIHYFISCAKKITTASLSGIAFFAVSLLLTACPPNKLSNKSVSAGKTLINIDSTTLIHHLAVISSAEMAGRETATPGNQAAREYIANNFDTLQLSKIGDSYFQSFPIDNNHQGINIIGVIKGTFSPDKYITITAHYDHLGTRNGTIFYGADDNASGTASLLAMARYFKQYPPRHSLLFVAFDAEEKGLLGSKYFVAHSPVPLQAIIANVNMDMVSRNDSNEIYASGIRHYPFLKKFTDSIQPLTSVHILYGHDGEKADSQDWTHQSDHFPFHQKQIPYLYFGVEDHADYHRPGDTFDKINKSFYYQVCTMITAVVQGLDREGIVQ